MPVVNVVCGIVKFAEMTVGLMEALLATVEFVEG